LRFIKGKVVHLSTVHHTHDVRITIKEASLVARDGYAVTVIGRKGSEVSGLSDRIKLVHINKPRTRAHRVLSLFSAYQLTSHEKPELVHFHDPELLLLAPLLRLKGFKVVYDVHENLPLQTLSKTWIWRPLRRSISSLVGRLELLLARSCHAVVVVEQEWSRRFSSNTSILCRNLPLRVESNRSSLQAVHNRASHFVYAGGVDYQRGSLQMVEATNATAGSNRIRLDLCGPVMYESLHSEIKRLNNNERVVVRGWLGRAELVSLMDQARAGLLILAPNPNYESALATKLFEYLQAGLPIIASDITSHSAIIKKYNCGILVPFGDVLALKDAMDRIASDDDLVEELAAGARRASADMLCFDDEFSDVLSHYKVLGVRPDNN